MTSIPALVAPVPWADGLVLRPEHFHDTDRRNETLVHLAGLGHDPWAFGFTRIEVDEVALASGELRLECEGVLPGGRPFRAERVAASIGNETAFEIRMQDDGVVVLAPGGDACSRRSLPAARIGVRAGTVELDRDWSPPALLVGPGHPLAADAARCLGGLAGRAAGLAASLRIPGSDRRPGAAAIERTHEALAEHIGMLSWMLSWPAVAPTALAAETLRLALAVRAAARVTQPFEPAWDPADQRGSLRAVLAAAEAAVASIGIPFRTRIFRAGPEGSGIRTVDGVESGPVVVAVEVDHAVDLPAARHWFEGAAVTAPDRVEEALTRRVGGAVRRALDRDSGLGIASGPRVRLYRVEADPVWRGNARALAVGSRAEMPCDATLSAFVPEPEEGDSR